MLPPRPPPRDACVLPTSKVNGGIIVVLFKYVRPSGLVYGAHTCEDCHSMYIFDIFDIIDWQYSYCRLTLNICIIQISITRPMS